MLSEREVSAAIGSTAYGANGDKLGTVESFFVDDRTGAPTWVAVMHRPVRHPALDRARRGRHLRRRRGSGVPVTAEAVKSAPSWPATT